MRKTRLGIVMRIARDLSKRRRLYSFLPPNDGRIQSYVAKVENWQLREGLIFVKGDENLVMAQF